MRRYYRRATKKTVNPLTVSRVILWENLTDEQKDKVRKTFWYIENTLPEGAYDGWLKSKGFYFNGYSHLSISMIYDKPQ